jgi:hypothetical protein
MRARTGCEAKPISVPRSTAAGICHVQAGQGPYEKNPIMVTMHCKRPLMYLLNLSDKKKAGRLGEVRPQQVRKSRGISRDALLYSSGFSGVKAVELALARMRMSPAGALTA